MEAVLADPALLQMLNAPADPADAEAWNFVPPAGVSQVARTCPPELRCPEGGEYFAQRWLEHMAAAGPYADSFLSGVMAPVSVQMANGQTIRPAVCVMRLTVPEDLQARSSLVLPRGVGRLGMQWQPAAVAGTDEGSIGGALATKLASVASITAPIPAPSLAPQALAQVMVQTTTETAMGQPAGPVVVDSSAAPILLLDLPYIASGDQAVGSPDSELEADPLQRLVLATNDRLRDEQTEVTRWARNNGRSLVWGDCGHAFEWAAAVYGSNVRSVSVGAPLGPDTYAAVDDGQQREAEGAPTPEPSIATGGANGIYSPAGGSVLSGNMLVQAAADLPDFWKWQLDVLVDGQTAAFVAMGEQPVPAPAPLAAINTANYPNGDHTLRLRVVHRDGNYEEYYYADYDCQFGREAHVAPSIT